MQTVQEVDKPMTELEVSLETGQGLERKLQVRVPAARIQREVEARLRSVGRTANIKGYRPGKVPEKVIRQRFGDQVRREVLSDVVQSTYNEAVNRQQLRPAGDAHIDAAPDAGINGGDFSYTASFEVFPEFSVQGLDAVTAPGLNRRLTMPISSSYPRTCAVSAGISTRRTARPARAIAWSSSSRVA